LLYQEWARYGVFYKFQPIDLIRIPGILLERNGTRDEQCFYPETKTLFCQAITTMFLENWKRLQMRLGYFWDLTGIEEEEEHSRPEYETKVREKLLRESGKSVVQKLDANSPVDDETKSKNIN
ncbi:hypothetical protein A6R68_07494, partial [Neotoma lepida]